MSNYGIASTNGVTNTYGQIAMAEPGNRQITIDYIGVNLLTGEVGSVEDALLTVGVDKALSTTPYNMTDDAVKYEYYANKGTMNPESSIVILGKYSETGLSYEAVGENIKATYFNLKNWDEVAAELGKENMWNVNKMFLSNQLKEGKTFILTHDLATATGYFKQEVNFLEQEGFKFVKEESMWKAIKN